MQCMPLSRSGVDLECIRVGKTAAGCWNFCMMKGDALTAACMRWPGVLGRHRCSACTMSYTVQTAEASLKAAAKSGQGVSICRSCVTITSISDTEMFRAVAMASMTRGINMRMLLR